MDTFFMNSENRKSFKLHVLILSLTNTIGLRRGEKSIALSNLFIQYTLKNKENHITIINLKNLLQHGMMNLNYKMGHILHQIFEIILIIFLKEHGENIRNPSIKIYVNEIENRIRLKTWTLKLDIILNL